MLEEFSGQVPKRGEGAAEGPDDTLQLHEISTLLIHAGSLHLLDDRIVDAAIGLMAADVATIQVCASSGAERKEDRINAVIFRLLADRKTR